MLYTQSALLTHVLSSIIPYGLTGSLGNGGAADHGSSQGNVLTADEGEECAQVDA